MITIYIFHLRANYFFQDFFWLFMLIWQLCLRKWQKDMICESRSSNLPMNCIISAGILCSRNIRPTVFLWDFFPVFPTYSVHSSSWLLEKTETACKAISLRHTRTDLYKSLILYVFFSIKLLQIFLYSKKPSSVCPFSCLYSQTIYRPSNVRWFPAPNVLCPLYSCKHEVFIIRGCYVG